MSSGNMVARSAYIKHPTYGPIEVDYWCAEVMVTEDLGVGTRTVGVLAFDHIEQVCEAEGEGRALTLTHEQEQELEELIKHEEGMS